MTGLDFTHLMAGSEGTLAIITKAVLKLLPLPRHSDRPACGLPGCRNCNSICSSNNQKGGIIPASIEFMDKKALELVEKYLGNPVPASDAGAALIIQLGRK